ncbi:unnamed protein product [Absidia cylindrospora]
MEPQQKFLQHFASQYCQHDINPNDISAHVATEHLNDVFNFCIKPSFPAQSQQLQTRQRFQPISTDDESMVEQLWKKMENGYDTVDIIEWIVSVSSSGELERILPKIIPLVLRVLDDYDVDYKTRGILLVHEMISVLDLTVITKFGLENVFIDALFKCLTYLSEDRDLPLLKSAYACLMDLINKTKPLESKERCILYEKMMMDGVVPGLTFAGNKPKFLLVLLEAIDGLTTELGVLLIRYLKVSLFGICNGLCSIDTNINQVALISLEHVIQQTSPRMAPYGSDVLRGLATLWLNHCNKKDNDVSQMLCERIKIIYRLLYDVCQDQLKVCMR